MNRRKSPLRRRAAPSVRSLRSRLAASTTTARIADPTLFVDSTISRTATGDTSGQPTRGSRSNASIRELLGTVAQQGSIGERSYPNPRRHGPERDVSFRLALHRCPGRDLASGLTAHRRHLRYQHQYEDRLPGTAPAAPRRAEPSPRPPGPPSCASGPGLRPRRAPRSASVPVNARQCAKLLAGFINARVRRLHLFALGDLYPKSHYHQSACGSLAHLVAGSNTPPSGRRGVPSPNRHPSLPPVPSDLVHRRHRRRTMANRARTARRLSTPGACLPGRQNHYQLR